MGIAFVEELATTAGKFAGVVKEKILASSDWAHLQLATGTQNTTLAATAEAEATEISTNATIPSGSVITIWRDGALNGAAAPESRVTTGVSGAGPYTVTFTDPLVAAGGTYQIGDAVGVGSFVTATTTRGCQMAVDLNTTLSLNSMLMTVYQSHDGTTGVDPAPRYLYWKINNGDASTLVRVTVSAGKEHLYLAVEGPRAAEPGTDSATYGSMRNILMLSDIIPYFDGSTDLAPAIAIIGQPAAVSYSIDQLRCVHMSRNHRDDESWAQAILETVCAAADASLNSDGPTYQAQVMDGSVVARPWIVSSPTFGLRGTLARAFFGGSSYSDGEWPAFFRSGSQFTYDGVVYKALLPFRSGSSTYNNSWAFGMFYNYTNAVSGPLLFIPVA